MISQSWTSGAEWNPRQDHSVNWNPGASGPWQLRFQTRAAGPEVQQITLLNWLLFKTEVEKKNKILCFLHLTQNIRQLIIWHLDLLDTLFKSNTFAIFDSFCGGGIIVFNGVWRNLLLTCHQGLIGEYVGNTVVGGLDGLLLLGGKTLIYMSGVGLISRFPIKMPPSRCDTGTLPLSQLLLLLQPYHHPRHHHQQEHHHRHYRHHP